VGPKFLRGTDINKTSFIDWDTVPYCPNANLDFEKFRLEPGDIVVIRMADPGKVGIIEKVIDAVFASYLVRLKRVTERISSYYLFYALSDAGYQGFITNASTGSTRVSASAKLLVNYSIIVPDRRLVPLFDDQVAPIRKQMNVLLNQNARLRQARDLLLPRLMSGEIAV
jgi:type I restriction enzyme S subunit